MHTVRNRQARTSRKGVKPPPAKLPSTPSAKLPSTSPSTSSAPPRSARDDMPFLLRQAAPPQTFPADLIVPPHRGAVITAAAWPGPAPGHRVPAQAAGLSRKAAKKAARRAAAIERAQARAPRMAEEAPPIALPDFTLSPPAQANLRSGRVETGCGLATAPALPPDTATTEPRSAPVEAASDPDMPLPAARALVARRQGFIDVLAVVLRDSGRRLARWSSARRRADDMKDKLTKAEARMRAMEAQLAALQALQARIR